VELQYFCTKKKKTQGSNMRQASNMHDVMLKSKTPKTKPGKQAILNKQNK